MNGRDLLTSFFQPSIWPYIDVHVAYFYENEKKKPSMSGSIKNL